MRTLFRNSSFLCTALFLGVAILFAAYVNYRNVTGDLVPLGCIAVALLAVAPELANWRKAAAGDVDWTGAGLTGLVLFGFYLFLIRHLGFLIATPLFTAVIFAVTQKKRIRGLAIGAVLGILLSALVYVLFVVLMENPLPGGMFE